ncbi:MAG: YceI family protein [Flavobacterium sp.]|nr:MAG: YceI family protein [Flavobacterium sp.]
MKKVVSSFFVAMVLIAAISCKSDKKNQASDAAQVQDASSEAVAYNVDTTATVINWTGSKQVGSHHGTIKLLTGIIYVKGDAVESGNFTINMNSIKTTDVKPEDGKADLEAHLKGTNMDEKADHFFNVKKYPEGKFEITAIKTENGKTMIEGNLTLKATTKNVKFPATVKVSDNEVTIESEKFVIDRTQWKINYGSKSVFTDLGDKFINDEIELKVSVKATK